MFLPMSNPYIMMQCGPFLCACGTTQSTVEVFEYEYVGKEMEEVEDAIAHVTKDAVAAEVAAHGVVRGADELPVLLSSATSSPASGRRIQPAAAAKIKGVDRLQVLLPSAAFSSVLEKRKEPDAAADAQCVCKEPDAAAGTQGAKLHESGDVGEYRLQHFWSIISQPELSRTPTNTQTLDSFAFQRIPSTVSERSYVGRGSELESVNATPDFSGRWLLTSLEGNFDEFLRDIGVSYLFRTMAKGFGYGVGKQLQDITQKEDEIKIVTEGGPRVICMTAKIGGGEFESLGLDGELNYVTLTWEDCMLKTESRRGDGSFAPPTYRFFMDGSTQVVETATSSGKVVKRFFTRQ